jgi:hypothetical protein
MLCSARGCSRVARHTCGACKSAHYCTHECQSADWHAPGGHAEVHARSAIGFHILKDNLAAFRRDLSNNSFPVVRPDDIPPKWRELFRQTYVAKNIAVYVVPWAFARTHKPDNVAPSGHFSHPVVVEATSVGGEGAVFYFQSKILAPVDMPTTLALMAKYLVNPSVFDNVLTNIGKLAGARDGVVSANRARKIALGKSDESSVERVVVPVGGGAVQLAVTLMHNKTDGTAYPGRAEVRAVVTKALVAAWDIVQAGRAWFGDDTRAIFPKTLIEVPPGSGLLGRNHGGGDAILLVVRAGAALDHVVDAEAVLLVLLHELCHTVAKPVRDNTPTIVFGKSVPGTWDIHGPNFHLALGRMMSLAVVRNHIAAPSAVWNRLMDRDGDSRSTAKFMQTLAVLPRDAPATEYPANDRIVNFSRKADHKTKSSFFEAAATQVGGGAAAAAAAAAAAEEDADDAAQNAAIINLFDIASSDDDDVRENDADMDGDERAGPAAAAAEAQGAQWAEIRDLVKNARAVTSRSKKNAKLFADLGADLYGTYLYWVRKAVEAVPVGDRVTKQHTQKFAATHFPGSTPDNTGKVTNQEFFARARSLGVKSDGEGGFNRIF